MIVKNGVTISSVLKGTAPIQVIKKGLETVFEGFKKLTVSGTPPLTLEKSVGKDLEDYKIYGESVQNGTPTPETPIEVESVGDKTKNLCNAIEENSLAYRDDYKNYTIENGKVTTQGDTLMGFIVPVKPNTTFSFGFILKRIAANYVSFRLRQYTQFPTTFTGSFDQPVNQQFTQNGLCSVNLTTSENINYVLLTIYTTGKLEAYDFMANEGETLLDFEPYGYKTPVKVIGKNLFNVEYYKNIDGWEKTGSYQYKAIKLEAGKTYTISYNIINVPATYGVGGNFRLGRFKTETTFTQIAQLAYSSSSETAGKRSVTFVSQGNEYFYNYVNGWFTEAKLIKLFEQDVIDIQIEQGTTSTDYEPYTEIVTNIFLNEPLRKIGDDADYIDYKNKKVVRNVGLLELDGVTNGKLLKSYTGGGYITISKMKVVEAGKGVGLCSFSKSTSSLVTEGIAFGWNNTNAYFCYINGLTNYTEINALINELYISGVDTNIYYQLATPTEETIELPTIATSKGTNIVDVETSIKPSNLEIEYFGLA